MQAAQHQYLARLLENQFRMLPGQQVGLEYGFGLGNHGADGAQHLAEGHFIEPEAPFGAQRRLGKRPMFGVQQE